MGPPIHTPIALPLAGGWPPAPCEGRRGSPSRESTRVPHLVTPASRLGFSGAGGALTWGLSLGWTQASQGLVAGHTRPPFRAALGPSPASCRGTWPRARSSRTLALCTPASNVLSWTEWVFCNRLFSRCLAPFLRGLWRTTLTWALSAARGRPLRLCHPRQLAPLAGPSDGSRDASVHPRAHNAFCIPLSWSPGAVAGPLPNLGPWSGQGQSTGHYAKTAQEGSMGSKVGTDWALQVPHLLAATPKEQN